MKIGWWRRNNIIGNVKSERINRDAAVPRGALKLEARRGILGPVGHGEARRPVQVGRNVKAASQRWGSIPAQQATGRTGLHVCCNGCQSVPLKKVALNGKSNNGNGRCRSRETQGHSRSRHGLRIGLGRIPGTAAYNSRRNEQTPARYDVKHVPLLHASGQSRTVGADQSAAHRPAELWLILG
jgi:hypothetical protein